MTFKRLEN